MRKRIAALALAAVMAFGLTACGGSDSSSTAASGEAGVSGEFTGTAQGIGEVKVTMTFSESAITEVVVDASNETADIGRGLGEQFASQILEKGAVDSVSGATVTSNAVSTALNDCLRQAGLMP